MKVTVFGASGGIGSEAVRQLLVAGHHVVAVMRRSSPSRNAGHPRLAIAAVPALREPEALVAALTGSDAVISAVGPRRLRDGPVTSTATLAILGAMTKAGVGRIVAVSASPVGRSAIGDGLLLRGILRPILRSVLVEHYLDLARMEGALAQSGLDWTVVRPPRLTSAPLTGTYRMAIDDNVPNGLAISRADVAHAMCAALADPRTIRHPVGVAS